MQAQQLDAFKWKNRILILSHKSADSDALQSQLKKFKADQKALIDRDLIIFLILESGVLFENGERSEMDAYNLREQLNISSDFEGILLIGKDGGVKMKEQFDVDPKKVFDLIDGMPMRRTEIRKSGKP